MERRIKDKRVIQNGICMRFFPIRLFRSYRAKVGSGGYY
jgi:hypothetical protein